MAKTKKSYPSFSIAEALEFGWKKFRDNIGLFFLILLISFGLSLSHYLLQAFVQPHDYATPIMLKIGIYILQMVLSLGNITLALMLYQRKKVYLRNMFSSISMLPKYIATEILKFFIIFLGFILFIIPGIIWSVYFGFALYLVIEKKLGPIKALKQSASLTKGYRMKLFLFGLVLFLINVLGFLCLIVGLMVTLPVTMLANVYIYKQITSQK